jgi:excisionase family DNA binding protein
MTTSNGELSDSELDAVLCAADKELLDYARAAGHREATLLAIMAAAGQEAVPAPAEQQSPRRVADAVLAGGTRRAHGPRTGELLLTPAQVATMFKVDPKTITRWAKAGKLTSIRTLGGHRRYRETEVRHLLAGILQQRSE